MSDPSRKAMSNVEKVRYHLAQCNPETVGEAHLKNALEALRDIVEEIVRRDCLARIFPSHELTQ